MSLATGGLISLAVAMGIGRFVYTPILPDMIEALGLTPTEAGLIAAANFLGYLVGALAASAAWLRGSHRFWFFVGLFTSGISTAAMGLTEALVAQMLIRLVGGVASAFVLVFASALILDRLAALGRPRFSALFFSGVGVGIVVSALVISVLGSQGYDWKVQWIASGVISLVAALFVVGLVPGDAHEVEQETSESESTTDGRLKRLIVAYGLYGFGYIITATFISTIARASSESRSLETVVWLVVGLSAIPSVALWTYLGRRWGAASAFAVACVVEAAGVALTVTSSSGWVMVVGGVLLGGTFVGIAALGLLYARSLAVGDSRRTLAFMTASFRLWPNGRTDFRWRHLRPRRQLPRPVFGSCGSTDRIGMACGGQAPTAEFQLHRLAAHSFCVGNEGACGVVPYVDNTADRA